jgi:hypothetical protein
MLKFIQNTGEFFSSNYFDEDFGKKVLDSSGYASDDFKEFNRKIGGLKDTYFRYKQTFIEGRLRTKDKIKITHEFHTALLSALGYDARHTQYHDLYHLDEKTVLPVRHVLYRGAQPHLMIMEMQALITEGDQEPDGLFQQSYNDEDDTIQPPQKYHRSHWEGVFKVPEGLRISPMIINKAVSELFLIDLHKRPRYILLCGGNQYFLLEQEKWFKGSYLQLDLEELFSEATVERNYYSVFYFLLAQEALAPQSEAVLMEQLDEDSHKSAYEVTKDLKEGVIHAVETLANETVYYRQTHDDINADLLKEDCLTMVYRLLFLFYAEARPDLDILPANDAVYQGGYSLEMLRDLEQVPLNTASSQNGYYFHESLMRLFGLMHAGYRERTPDDANRSFRVRRLDSPLFDDRRLTYLPKVKIRNVVWQDVICQLSLSRRQRGRARGRISYANLGINQLGSVYESLLAFRGFFADTDYIEVHRARKSNESSERVADKDGSYLVPRHRLEDFKPEELYYEDNDELRVIPKGTFIYRLSGRDRQKSASYYTPEVLTACTVKYTLKPILERLDRGEMKALDLLQLKILEPAMGAAAFHNEVINQLADAYLAYRQEELKKKVAPDHYREELQKVKTYIALNNVYGVDLNPTAVELGKLSLWLNVIHRDMPTPFFGYRLGVGNAVVGAWLKAYDYKDVRLVPIGKSGKKFEKKEWWDKAPKHLRFGDRKINRRETEIYHFLLPDPGMVASAGIRLLKDTHPDEVAHVRAWRREFCEPISGDEYQRLVRIGAAVDRLLEQHYQFQKQIDAYAAIRGDFFGAYDQGENVAIALHSYAEKEELARKRYAEEAPYAKLKLIMDYWCALWFWDVRAAEQLPTRQQWYDDLENILNVSLTPAAEATTVAPGWANQRGEQTSLFAEPKQLSLGTYRPADETQLTIAEIARLKDRSDLFDDSERLRLVSRYAQQYRFFHYQLEFVEVFRERNGFDVAVGNPPWLKLQFEKKDVIAEKFPEILFRKTSDIQVRQMQDAFLDEESKRELFLGEYIGTEAAAEFMNATQNYPLLVGQQTNLYKCVLENGFHWVSERGFLGLIHPEGIYDDPNGQPLRREVYPRLKYHFQFKNELMLFSEIDHHNSYGLQVYAGKKSDVSFLSINNLFHPSTIDGSFIHDGHGLAGGYKVKDESSGKMSWNTKPHANRIVHFTKKELAILAKTFEDSEDWESTKLVSIHAQEVISILEKLGEFSATVKDTLNIVSEGWHESGDVADGNIRRNTKFPDVEKFEMIYSGPHFFVGNPLYKTPREVCEINSDYDIIDHSLIDERYTARTNYIPPRIDFDYIETIKGFLIGYDDDNIPIYDNWLEYYKAGFRRMLSLTGERTLNGAILPPKTAHIHPVISVTFKDSSYLVEFMGLTSSVCLDFFIKTVGRSDLYETTIKNLPLGIAEHFKPALFVRTLLLNCLNKYYAPLWERHWQEAYLGEQWSINDPRLKAFGTLTPAWQWATPLRNWYERRQALVEIDVIVAQALGLSLEELVLMYNVQFPVLQQNEDDTWYDQTGNIVFTCSRGLTGVGVDRPIWEQIRDFTAGETYTHTIEKSELYRGQTVVYHAPFTRCDRVEDYKVAWAHFAGVFGSFGGG